MIKLFRKAGIFLFLVFAASCRDELIVPDQQSPEETHILGLTDSAHSFDKAGNKKKALEYHKRALETSREHRLPEHEARALLNIATLLDKDDSAQSLVHLQNALAIARSIGHHDLQVNIYSTIAEIYRQQANYKEAIVALEAHQQLIGKLLERNKKREITELKAEQEIKLERGLGLAVTVSILAIAIVLAVYSRKIKRLNRQLEESVQVKDKLFSILGHDLRGPASSLAQALNLLEVEMLSGEDGKKVLSKLKKQSQNLSDALDSLLQWANSQFRQMKANPRNFKPGPMTDKNLALLEGQSQQKSIRIINQIPPDISVLADADQFDFVIRNLLSNAIKFSHEGGHIEIASALQEDEVIFTITDYGIGITPEKQKQFLSYNMDTSYGTSGEKGVGLGLLLVKEFIQINHGRIWLKSEPGVKTVFFFTLPRPPQEIQDDTTVPAI